MHITQRVNNHILYVFLKSCLLALSLQGGDAHDSESHDVFAVVAESMEESDGHVCNTTLPKHGKVLVLHSNANYRKLTQRFVCPRGGRAGGRSQVDVKSLNDSSGTHELL